MRIIEVLPESWIDLHSQGDCNCWCHPQAQIIDDSLVLFHNNPKGDKDTDWGVYDYDEEGHVELVAR